MTGGTIYLPRRRPRMSETQELYEKLQQERRKNARLRKTNKDLSEKTFEQLESMHQGLLLSVTFTLKRLEARLRWRRSAEERPESGTWLITMDEEKGSAYNVFEFKEGDERSLMELWLPLPSPEEKSPGANEAKLLDEFRKKVREQTIREREEKSCQE